MTFNGIAFDIPCLEGVLGRSLALRAQYDIFAVIKGALGRERTGIGLGPTCERTLGLSKIQTGVKAPELYQQGRFPELYTYCAHDVHLTSVLFAHIMGFGYVIGPDGDKLCLNPVEETVARN